MPTDSSATAARASRLMSGYKPFPATPDEILSPNGEIRPVWREFLGELEKLSTSELADRLSRGDQYLKDAGVFYRQPDSGNESERQWPLSSMPVLIAEDEWDKLCTGLAQRADLLEAIAADLYSDARLVETGQIPAQLVAQSTEWVRPMVNVMPPSGRFLHFVAFEIGRAPDGQWWVLNDRTQAPSGAGFALENRVASSRIFADIYGRMNVHRLAGFFKTFQDSLFNLRIGDDSQAAILSPGPLSATYFEHAYIARYLNLLLVEGEDIVVEKGRPMVRTIGGLKPVSVLWRRLDTLYSDPLELGENSQIGIPGLLGAIRQNSVSMVNSIGSGVLETRALLAFMPLLCRSLLGEDLKIPNVATWWCGDPKVRDTVLANLDRMSLAPALSTRLPFDPDDNVQLGDGVRSRDPDVMRQLLGKSPEAIVGQELVTLSTTPALVDGRLEPRPFSLRVFMVRTQDGWQAMPGGYARIGRGDDVTAIAMNRGGSVADVWVVSQSPVDAQTLITNDGLKTRPSPSDLPSRAAENLFWLGRYMERAETATRLARAYLQRKEETGGAMTPLLSSIAAYMKAVGYDAEINAREGIASAIAAAHNCAKRVRDRLSPDGLLAVNQLRRMTRLPQGPVAASDGFVGQKGEILRQLAGFTGLLHENMYRSSAWRMLASGRALERISSYAFMLAHFAAGDEPRGALHVALECGDSVHSHRLFHGFHISCETVVELLGYDQMNPRSIHAQLLELEEHLGALPAPRDTPTTPVDLVRAQKSEFLVMTPATVTPDQLRSLGAAMAEISNALHQAYMS